MGDQMLTSPAEAKLIIAMVKIQARLQNITASGIIAIACLGAVLLLSHALVVMLPALPIETNALGIYSARRASIIASPGRRDAMCFRRVLALPAIIILLLPWWSSGGASARGGQTLGRGRRREQGKRRPLVPPRAALGGSRSGYLHFPRRSALLGGEGFQRRLSGAPLGTDALSRRR